jgi:glucosyl-dolichyl phosphate glucuronosyltransferase
LAVSTCENESKQMNITVILCTYNRCQSLAKTLTGLAAQAFADRIEWEVLVVDNNSRDRTREVVEDFSLRYPGRFRYLFEPHPGKCHALNAGIQEARGDVLAFTDDDVLIEPLWLRNLTAPLNNGEWAGAGGRVLPEWSGPVPRWLLKNSRALQYTLALFDQGGEAGELTEPPFGNNMAFRREMFEKYGGFRTNLGPHSAGKGIQRGEDSEFGQRLLSAGERLRYEPSAVVRHWVPEERLQQGYLLAWSFGHGCSSIRAFGVPSEAKWHVLGIPLYSIRRLVRWIVQWMITIDAGHRFGCKLKVWSKMGEILECYRHAHKLEIRRIPTTPTAEPNKAGNVASQK